MSEVVLYALLAEYLGTVRTHFGLFVVALAEQAD